MHLRLHLRLIASSVIENGTPTDVVARVGWLFDEQRFFDVDPEGKCGAGSSVPDTCP